MVFNKTELSLQILQVSCCLVKLEDLVHVLLNALKIAQVKRELLEEGGEVLDRRIVVLILQADFCRLQLHLLIHQFLLESLDSTLQQRNLLSQIVCQSIVTRHASAL